jgi:hypothetical protein
MLILPAYFDETGHSQDKQTKFLGIAGCVCEVGIWQKVERKWKQMLDSESLPYFHMKEFAHSRGVFQKWKGKANEPKRREVYNRLWQIILEDPIIPVGCFVSFKDYSQYFQEAYNEPFSEPYYLCYLQCLKYIAQFRHFKITSQILPVFDDKKGIQGESHKIYDILLHRFNNKVAKPYFGDMRQLIGLQIADIIAYESKKEFEREAERPDADSRWGFYRLDEMIKKTTGKYPLVFGDQTSPIMLLTSDELKEVSGVHKMVDEMDIDESDIME